LRHVFDQVKKIPYTPAFYQSEPRKREEAKQSGAIVVKNKDLYDVSPDGRLCKT
jgi:hypothetical protein